MKKINSLTHISFLRFAQNIDILNRLRGFLKVFEIGRKYEL